MKYQRILDGSIFGLMSGITKEPDHCPHCGKHIDAATCTSEAGVLPEPGAFTVCSDCLGVSVFGDTLRLRKLNEWEINLLAENKELQRDLAEARKVVSRSKRE